MMVNDEGIMKDKIRRLQQSLRAREERIIALETENAMLYLKLAQCQGNLKSAKVDLANMRKLFEAHSVSHKNALSGIRKHVKDLMMLRSEWNKLRQEVQLLPSCFQTELKQFHSQIEQFTAMYQSRASKHTMDTEELQLRLLDAEMALDEAMKRANTERTRRRTLHNTLVELRGNIRVHCRPRPLIPSLDAGGDVDLLGLTGTPSEQVLYVVDEETLAASTVTPGGGATKVRHMEYERVYMPSDSQQTVFADVAPLLTSLLDGYNVCIMAYGQTGSGKTHTMLGSHEENSDISAGDSYSDEGIIPRSAREIFRLIEERKTAADTFQLEISVCEIYNNEICDLLASPDQDFWFLRVCSNVMNYVSVEDIPLPMTRFIDMLHGCHRSKKHNVFSASDGSQEIPTLITKPVYTVQDVMALVHFGLIHRHEDATLVHAHSSRSHLIVQLNIHQTTLQGLPTRGYSPDSTQSQVLPSPPSTPTLVRRILPQVSSEGASAAGSPKRRSRSPAPRSGAKSPAVGTQGSRIPRAQSTSTSGERSRSPSPSQSSSSSNDQLTRSGPTPITVKTKLQLVDLAGSECVAMSGATGAAFRETSNINKSLSALADVLQALAEHRQHIPYRNTKLTHMLQDTIGGDAKLLVMLCVSPVQKYITESLQCLGFGSRARQVARGPAKRRRPTTPVAASFTDSPLVSLSLRSTLSGSSGNLSPRTFPGYKK